MTGSKRRRSWVQWFCDHFVLRFNDMEGGEVSLIAGPYGEVLVWVSAPPPLKSINLIEPPAPEVLAYEGELVP